MASCASFWSTCAVLPYKTRFYGLLRQVSLRRKYSMGYKLLLADDSITIQKVVAIIFASEDYDLTVVDNGIDTLAKAREIMPDAILVDALMPGKSGYDVCREVRLDPVLKDIPLLLLVGAFEPFDEEKAGQSGADDHISKPFESQSLIEKVKKLVELGKERAIASASAGVNADVSAPPVVPDLGGVQYPEVMSAPEESTSFAPDSLAGEKSPDVLSLESMHVVEVTPEDDLWGAFEVTEISEGEDVRLGEVVEGDEFQPEIIDTVEEIEPFVFTEEEQASSADGNTISLGEFPEPGVDGVVESEESFVFREEPESEEFGEFASPGRSFNFSEAAGPGIDEAENEELSAPDGLRAFGEPVTQDLGAYASHVSPEPTSMLDGVNYQFAPDEGYAPAPDILSGVGAGDSIEVRETGVPGTINLSEKQLASILSNVSREIIEKIAWEVVPDLAESIIREEIRKIKEGH
jgi:CheY-like chemotaxis protein